MKTGTCAVAPWPCTPAACRDGGDCSVACDHGWSREKNAQRAVQGEEDGGGVSLAQGHRERQEGCSTELGPASMAASRSWALERWRGEEASGEWRGNDGDALVLLHDGSRVQRGSRGSWRVSTMVGRELTHHDHTGKLSSMWRASE